MSIYRVISWIVGNGCFLWPACSPDKTLLAFALHFVIQGPPCLLFWVSLDFLLLHSSPLWWKGHLFWVLVLKGLVGLHRTIQLQFLQRYWLGHRLGLLWYWMVCLGNEQRSICRFWDCIQVLHFRLFCWPWCPFDTGCNYLESKILQTLGSWYSHKRNHLIFILSAYI